MNNGKTRKLILTLGIMTFLASGDNYSAAPLLLDISQDLGTGFSQSALSVSAYMLAFGLFTVLFGPLGDRFGKTKILKCAAFGTALFSCLGAAAFDLPSLIAFRAVNGAFAAGIFPVSVALVGESAAKEERQKSIAKIMGMMFLGTASATAVGGLIAYIGSWRHVYLAYGIAEFIIALVMLKVLEPSAGTMDSLNFINVYKKALSVKDLRKTIAIVFLVGFAVLGSFVYSGQLIQGRTGYNILFVGLLLTIFGLGTLTGARLSPKIRKKLKSKLLVSAGALGLASLVLLGLSSSAILMGAALFGFGVTFIVFQSTLVAYAQECLPSMRGTAMSLVSFNMVLGGGAGTLLGGAIMNSWGIETIYFVGAAMLFIVGILSALQVFPSRRRQGNLYPERP